MPHPLETYLKTMLEVKLTGGGVEETSYYPALSNLMNEVGKNLSPKVICVITLKNKGAGLPDGGFFSADQVQRYSQDLMIKGQLPSRGAIEAKGLNECTKETAQTQQVSLYVERYSQVLVTNYREFLLVGKNESGVSNKLEAFCIADTEEEFWKAARTPKKTRLLLEERFVKFLQRAMVRLSPLTDPEVLAWYLASYAREAFERIKDKNPPSLNNLRQALETALGLEFKNKKGDHFFHSTLVQTLFYGIFSAWIMWNKMGNSDSKRKFEWKETAWLLHVPMVRNLFEQIAVPSQLGQLNLVEVLDWTESLLNRVDKSEFFKKFEKLDAVQYFYEPFLHEFDPVLQKELGIWYTPHEIVSYMVERVDRVLRTELGLADGLANPNVYVLDPAAGTGSFLVESLRVISKTLASKGEDALMASDIKKAAMERILGFELLPAPFVVAHLQVGLLLHEVGSPLSDDGSERVGIYLTNSLTGWGERQDVKQQLLFPELLTEMESSDEAKKKKPILVVMGNPPYNGFAGTSPVEEEGLVKPYKKGLRKLWNIKKSDLNDLYIRFLRIAERRIAEQTGRGIVCYITNSSFIDRPSFVILRQRFLKEFDVMWFDNLNGSSRETGKLTPEGNPDPSVFSTSGNPTGIRVGTVVSLLLKKPTRQDKTVVKYRDFWGSNKREALLKSLEDADFESKYEIVEPHHETRFSFSPLKSESEYFFWPSVFELADLAPYNGLIERRGNSFIKIKEDITELKVIAKYLDPNISNDEIKAIEPRFMKKSGEFDPENSRKIILGKHLKYDSSKIIDYYYKPFDLRKAYLDNNLQPLFSRPNPDLLSLSKIENNAFLISRDTAEKSPEGPPAYYSTTMCDASCLSGNARVIPFWLTDEVKNKDMLRKQESLYTNFEESTSSLKVVSENVRNLSSKAIDYLTKLRLSEAEFILLWYHVLSICYSEDYLVENKLSISSGWPRVPLPADRDSLLRSAHLGQTLAALLNTGEGVSDLTGNKIGNEFKLIAQITKIDGKNLRPEVGELELHSGWGYISNMGSNTVVMPGGGKLVVRNYSSDERTSLFELGRLNKIGRKVIFELIGKKTCDIYLNDIAYWRNIPILAWEYVVGGYQVTKKWLSYREYEVLGRGLTSQEAREFTAMVRRIVEILLMKPQLDENYRKIKEEAYRWVAQRISTSGEP